ncbi:hypothetical protein FQZ97_1242030 [compost metagenome]
MVVVEVDDHAVEHALHLLGHLVEQQVEFTRPDEFGDVVVRVKALASRLHTLADLDGDGCSVVVVGDGWGHGGVGFHEHGACYHPLFFQA